MKRWECESLYLSMLKDKWEMVDKTNLNTIKEYNEWKRKLRKELLDNDRV